MTLLVAGLGEQLQVSSAVGAFLVGIASSGPVEQRALELLTPLRDLFAALFFVFFGFQVDPSDLPGALATASVLAIITAITKFGTGWWSSARSGIAVPGRLRAGTVLIARGEFSIVIAGIAMASGVDADIGPIAAAYVLLLAVAGPVITRAADPIGARVVARHRERAAAATVRE